MPGLPNHTDLPLTVAKIARLIGRDKALALAGSTQNGRIYVPKKIAQGHRIAQTVGLDEARKIAGEWGGEVIYLAKCQELRIQFRNTAIRRWAAEGRSRQELADLTGLTVRMIDNVLAG